MNPQNLKFVRPMETEFALPGYVAVSCSTKLDHIRFSLLMSRPEIDLNHFNTRIILTIDCKSSDTIRVVSSAYCDTLDSSPCISMPLISLFSLMICDKISCKHDLNLNSSPNRLTLKKYYIRVFQFRVVYHKNISF